MYAIDEETRAKIAKLPTWARELVKRLEIANGPLLEETVRLRKQVSDLTRLHRNAKERCEAMQEIFRRAGEGGSDYAAAVVRVLEGYEIFPPASPTETPTT